jgi:hypothetical protein
MAYARNGGARAHGLAVPVSLRILASATILAMGDAAKPAGPAGCNEACQHIGQRGSRSASGAGEARQLCNRAVTSAGGNWRPKRHGASRLRRVLAQYRTRHARWQLTESGGGVIGTDIHGMGFAISGYAEAGVKPLMRVEPTMWDTL